MLHTFFGTPSLHAWLIAGLVFLAVMALAGLIFGRATVFTWLSTDTKRRGESLARAVLLLSGLLCLTWGANVKVALGSYLLASWAYAHADAACRAALGKMR